MLILTCTLCERNASYSAEELLERYFICKHCRWLNFLEAKRGVRKELSREAQPRNENLHNHNAAGNSFDLI